MSYVYVISAPVDSRAALRLSPIGYSKGAGGCPSFRQALSLHTSTPVSRTEALLRQRAHQTGASSELFSQAESHANRFLNLFLP